MSLLDEDGTPLKASNHDRRFFEAAWVHRRGDLYYFSYSIGDTHFLVYATGDNPFGPFTYRGRILEPVIGWTMHHSIVEFQGKWYLFSPIAAFNSLFSYECSRSNAESGSIGRFLFLWAISSSAPLNCARVAVK